MFGFMEDILDIGTRAVKKAVDDPVGFAVDAALSPATNTIDIIDGLTEGELRIKAALVLGADVASGMAVSELIEWYSN